MGQRPGVQGHHRQAVGEDVVHLAGDPGALGRPGRLGPQRRLGLGPLGPLDQRVEQLVAGADGGADGHDGRGDDDGVPEGLP